MQHLEVSGAVRPIYGSLGVKGLKFKSFKEETYKLIYELSNKITSYLQYIILFDRKKYSFHRNDIHFSNNNNSNNNNNTHTKLSDSARTGLRFS